MEVVFVVGPEGHPLPALPEQRPFQLTAPGAPPGFWAQLLEHLQGNAESRFAPPEFLPSTHLPPKPLGFSKLGIHKATSVNISSREADHTFSFTILSLNSKDIKADKSIRTSTPMEDFMKLPVSAIFNLKKKKKKQQFHSNSHKCYNFFVSFFADP